MASVVGLLGLCASPSASAALTPERPVRVTIQAQPRFESPRTTFAPGGAIEFAAELVGDTGAPIIGADVGVLVTRSERGVSFSPCAPASIVRTAPREVLLRTGESGRLCVRVSGAAAEGSLKLTFGGDAMHLPAASTIALQPTPSSSSLTFDAPSLELDLDQPTLRLRLGISDAAGSEPLPPIELTLHDGGRVIPLDANDWSRSEGTLSFSIDTRQLGTPGPARLVARRAGTEPSAHAEAIALRVATVRLGAEVLEKDRDSSEIRVWTETRAGVTPSGWVEATRGPEGEPVGSAPFVQGSARLGLGTSAAGGDVTLHYRSDDPWWIPGAPLRLDLHGSGPRGPRRWPWLALLVPIGYICLRSLQRPAQRKTQRRPLPKPRPAELVVELSEPLSGWVGHVSDAHDGQPIPGALVQALLPSFRGSESNALSAVADARGWFELPALTRPLPEGARLRVSAPLHSEVERALPPQGRVSIALTSRRRAVLRRLVRWAHALGSPWSRGGEPTPGEIANIAARRGDPRTARWAEDVQAAAFGGTPVDEAVEAALRAAEPAWHASRPRGEGRDD
jgi:hypothetical protein